MALTGYPDGPAHSYPNQSGGSNVSSGAFAVNFGFPASIIKFANDGVGPCYIFLDTTSTGNVSTGSIGGRGPWNLSTQDLLTDVYDLGVQISGFAYATSATGGTLRYAAWG